jgi:uncharacterized membrane protein YjdF
MHGCSAVMIGFLGFSLVDILNVSNDNVTLTPFFIALFSFCFAVSLGAIWEIYEFTSDSVLKTNMQKYKLEDGTELIGKEALTDTMEDIIVDAIGACSASIIGYISIKYKKGWISGLRIRIKGKRDEYVIDEDDFLKTDDSAHLK